ncbi:hypothetical protein HYU50_02145 [Candidatus Woesearchaeota archaeon]|nr:hypothetical protein [Candidatus Woesearchaeota archaeon]
MDSLLWSVKPAYFSTAFSNIEERLQPSNSSSMGSNLADFLDDDGEGQANSLYSSWGEWLQWWDAIDFMQNRLESDGVVRRVFTVEDILYHWHYIPYRGHKDDLFNSADMQFSYEDYEEEVFYFGPAKDEETTGYASSSVSYLPTPPDDDMEGKEDVREDNDAAKDVPMGADEINEPDDGKIEAQIETNDTLSEAVRLLFASKENKKKSLPQKLKLLDKAFCNVLVPDYD